MSRTIFSLPYITRRTGVLKGQRAEQQHVYRDELTLEIPDLALADVPVGLRILPAQGTKGAIEHRVWNGVPLWPVHAMLERASQPLTIELLRRMLSADNLADQYFLEYPLNRDFPAAPRNERYKSPFRVPPIADAQFRHVAKNHDDVDRSKALAIASKLVFIDGRMYRAAEELSWYLTSHADGIRRFSSEFRSYRAAAQVHFPGNRFADLERFVDAWRATLTPIETAVHHANRIEDAGLIDWGADKSFDRDLKHTLNAVVATPDYKPFRTLPREAFQIWCDLREIHGAWYPNPQRERAVDTLRTFATCVREAGHEFSQSFGVVEAYIAPILLRSELTDPIATPEADADALAFGG